MSLAQVQTQKQLLKLSPQQIQLMKMVQMPMERLEEHVYQEIEENPALEIVSDYETEEHNLDNSFEDEQPYEDNDPTGEKEEYDNIDISDYIKDYDNDEDQIKMYDEEASYHVKENKDLPFARQEDSLFEKLQQQLGILKLSPKEYTIAEQIIGNIDYDGYLRRDISSIVNDLAFRKNIDTSEPEVECILKKVQSFDPAGIGARNLQECLLLQLYRVSNKTVIEEKAVTVLKKYFEEFAKKHYTKLVESLAISNAELKKIIDLIVKLNPKPGRELEGAEFMSSFIVPDFNIINDNGVLELSLNAKNAPPLRISNDYKDLLMLYEKKGKKNKIQQDAVLFVKQKIDAAKNFIGMIHQRYQTLYTTMSAIMKYQEEFFLSGDETLLKPMILKDIAQITDMDISTISRVVNSKFVGTEFGTFRLKYFFSESVSTSKGDEVTVREVKNAIFKILENENKETPMGDLELAKALQKEGYKLSRRTVAKYREQLNIPVARLRKML